MNAAARVSAFLLVVAAVSGTLDDKSLPRTPIILGGYHVLAADFHVHPFPLSGGTIAPWDLVREAQKQGLDAIAITPHNDAHEGRSGQWFSRLIGGPIVINGEEVHSGGYHIIAAGVHDTVSWRQSAASTIAEIHRQGGVAIAAHPLAWLAYDDAAMNSLDGAEVLQPIAFERDAFARQMREFYARRPLAAIGSSDYHGLGPLGVCRTWVFARENTEAAIIEAIRAHRTVVFDRGQIFGDPAMVRLATDGRLKESRKPVDGPLTLLSRYCGFTGLIIAALFAQQSSGRRVG